MKKVLSLLAVAGLIAAASAASAATIVNSKHDLSGTSHGNSTYSGSSTQICVYCHAPHNANLSLPLWNRSNPAGSGFTLYSGINMANVSFKTGFTSDSTSLFCMSCHDGITKMSAVHNAGAIDGTGVDASGVVHTAAIGVFGNKAINGAANLTKDLSKTHPINFPVSLTDSQTDLNVGSGAHMGPGSPIGFGYSFTKTFPLFKSSDASASRSTKDRSLECGSCHAVHDSQFSPFLRDTMAGSQLCLGCHNK